MRYFPGHRHILVIGTITYIITKFNIKFANLAENQPVMYINLPVCYVCNALKGFTAVIRYPFTAFSSLKSASSRTDLGHAILTR